MHTKGFHTLWLITVIKLINQPPTTHHKPANPLFLSPSPANPSKQGGGPQAAAPGPLFSPGTAASEPARRVWEAGVGSKQEVGPPPRSSPRVVAWQKKKILTKAPSSFINYLRVAAVCSSCSSSFSFSSSSSSSSSSKARGAL